MESVKILGGGLAGLTAAITLKQAGIHVEVHERKPYCGKQTNNFQFFENWTFDQDVLEFIQQIHISADFYHKPVYQQEFYGPKLQHCTGKSEKPLLYLVKRGRAADSIDTVLADQARRQGVVVIHQSNLTPRHADIIATGTGNSTFIVTGIRFVCPHPDQSIVLLDNRFSAGFYSYFVVDGGVGEIVCVNPSGVDDHDARLNMTIDRFRRLLDMDVHAREERFTGPVNFGFLRRAKIDTRYHVGEAAGFQDQLAGFGMFYALKSGYWAAKSLIENADYDTLWQKEFLKSLEVSERNRAFYDRLSNTDFNRLIAVLKSKNRMIRYLRGGDDLRLSLKRIYQRSFPPFLRLLIAGRLR